MCLCVYYVELKYVHKGYRLIWRDASLPVPSWILHSLLARNTSKIDYEFLLLTGQALFSPRCASVVHMYQRQYSHRPNMNTQRGMPYVVRCGILQCGDDLALVFFIRLLNNITSVVLLVVIRFIYDEHKSEGQITKQCHKNARHRPVSLTESILWQNSKRSNGPRL